MWVRMKYALVVSVLWGASVKAGVLVTASASGVQLGGTVTFTATTTEMDPVVKVTFTYQGTSESDEDTTFPYQVATAMDWDAMENLTVTATFDFQNIPDQQDTVDVDVVDITLLGPTQPLRGSTANYWAFTDPTGLSVSTWDWSYDGTLVDPTWSDTADSNDNSRWYGTIAESGTVEVSATILGVSCTKDATVTVRGRSGGSWVTPIACVEDNDPNWGSPIDGQSVFLSDMRDKDSDQLYIIVPQDSLGWSSGVTLSEITSGPNDGIWYVAGNSLEIDQETVINQFAKFGGPAPESGAENFFDYNDETGGCIEDDMTDFIQALKNHEYRGTPSTAESLEGHFGRLEYKFDSVDDPAAEIEPLVATSESTLEASVDNTIDPIEEDLKDFIEHGTWSNAGPNWGGTGSLGSGKHTRYDPDNSEYHAGCTFTPEKL